MAGPKKEGSNGMIPNMTVCNMAGRSIAGSDMQIPTAQILRAQIPTAQILRAQIPTAQILRAQIPTAQILRAQIPTAQILRAQIPTAQIPTRPAPVERLPRDMACKDAPPASPPPAWNAYPTVYHMIAVTPVSTVDLRSTLAMFFDLRAGARWWCGAAQRAAACAGWDGALQATLQSDITPP
eukprot:354908-Chlamydomonas_euryale.AAC.8